MIYKISPNPSFPKRGNPQKSRNNQKYKGPMLLGGKDMEIYEKVRKYLYENIGRMTTTGTPKYDLKENVWKVPVLCKTERGIIIVGEFHVDKNGNFTNIPTKEEMLKTVKQEIKKLPFLYYGTKKELDKQKIKPVAV